MRLSRDKVNKLAHSVADRLAELEQVEFIEDRNSIRMEVRRLLEVPGRERYIALYERLGRSGCRVRQIRTPGSMSRR